MELTLLTINTWKCDGDYYNRIAVLKRQLRKMDAQIILCQECFRSVDGQVDTLEQLSQALEMPAWFVPCRQKLRRLEGRWIESFSGLGILTALPVLGQAGIDLPSDPADGGRKAQLLTIGLLTGERLLLANIHLTHLPDEELRRRQLAAVLGSVQNPGTAFTIIGGDWNAESQSPVLAAFRRSASAADCYVLGQGDEPRCSLLACHRKGLSVCVDHFYTLQHLNSSSYPRFTRAGIVLDQPDDRDGLYPSDHFGIRVTLIY